ncbi:pre-readthrough protein [Potato necrosis virus]|nr:pre-readthrough protein [Potato necrosis virus]ALF95241.1 pre-readthrough protein [Potato necrosis virus]
MELPNHHKQTASEGFVSFLNWLCNPWRRQRTVNAAVKLQLDIQSLDDVEHFEDINECFEETSGGQSQRTKVVPEGGYAPVKSNRTRRVRKPKRLKFVKYLVNEARAEFGLPKATEANKLMVQHFLLRTCKEWGVVTSQTQSNVALALPLVFIPTEEDLLSRALMNTYATRAAVQGMTNTQGEGWWNNRLGIGAQSGLAFRAK